MTRYGPPGGAPGQPTIRARARSREDRAGDPLDGLVNLFDLGIVLSIAFLLSSLSSLNLTDDLINRTPNRNGAPEGSIVTRAGETVRTIELRPGERVVGQGERLGTVYRLADGRTVIVPDAGSTPDAGTTPGAGTTPDAGTTPGAATTP
ncbi:DUF2149 domain-containing protein [Conexibacter stalactiti]|uniref:DUF2149 domain-containing protein n=1 Tax=Conexibacter stalactiti TaxID=1940611 RepID=A0ABU4HIW5_9ACTN|nr:DUF2149 domain-containing protein [Conexibacter stalactiti]MDW5593202.1 DUF2149 domain-containing protein [Conexibacter stalactiti]MEC5033843.1 DUF2149 domain-containing protein [Conexibacter stalactiti]